MCRECRLAWRFQKFALAGHFERLMLTAHGKQCPQEIESIWSVSGPASLDIRDQTCCCRQFLWPLLSHRLRSCKRSHCCQLNEMQCKVLFGSLRTQTERTRAQVAPTIGARQAQERCQGRKVQIVAAWTCLLLRELCWAVFPVRKTLAIAFHAGSDGSALGSLRSARPANQQYQTGLLMRADATLR